MTRKNSLNMIKAQTKRLFAPPEVEIRMITLFDSMEAIEAIAGTDPTVTRVTPKAKRLLSRFEETVSHCETALVL